MPKCSGCGMNTAPAPGAPASRAAPIWTTGRQPASRAINQTSGPISEPIAMIGRADARAVWPKTVIDAAWRIDDSGSQWPLPGTGRTGFAGMCPPTSAKIQMKSTFRP